MKDEGEEAYNKKTGEWGTRSVQQKDGRVGHDHAGDKKRTTKRDKKKDKKK